MAWHSLVAGAAVAALAGVVAIGAGNEARLHDTAVVVAAFAAVGRFQGLQVCWWPLHLPLGWEGTGRGEDNLEELWNAIIEAPGARTTARLHDGTAQLGRCCCCRCSRWCRCRRGWELAS